MKMGKMKAKKNKKNDTSEVVAMRMRINEHIQHFEDN